MSKTEAYSQRLRFQIVAYALTSYLRRLHSGSAGAWLIWLRADGCPLTALQLIELAPGFLEAMSDAVPDGQLAPCFLGLLRSRFNVEPGQRPEAVAFRLGLRQFPGGELADLFTQQSFQGVKALVHAVEASLGQVNFKKEEISQRLEQIVK